MCEFDTREYKFALFNCISLFKTIIRPVFTQHYREYIYTLIGAYTFSFEI